MQAVFKNPRLQKEFDRKGYVVVPGFLDDADIGHLQRTYDGLATQMPEGSFHVTNWSENRAYRESSHKEVTETLVPKSGELLDAYEPILGCYAVKPSGPESAMGIHQDWSLVDERMYTSVSFWCPMVDVTENNGVLQIFEGSHRLFQNNRGQHMPYPFKNVQDIICGKLMVNVPVKKGDALILHHRLVHRSLPNLSGNMRLVAMLAMRPQQAKVRHYYMLPDNGGKLGGEVEVYECADDFYLHFDISQKPELEDEAELVETYNWQPHFFTEDELLRGANQLHAASEAGKPGMWKNFWLKVKQMASA